VSFFGRRRARFFPLSFFFKKLRAYCTRAARTTMQRLPSSAAALRLWEAADTIPAQGLAALLRHEVPPFASPQSGSRD